MAELSADKPHAFVCYRRMDSFAGALNPQAPGATLEFKVTAALQALGFDPVFLDVSPEHGAQEAEHWEQTALVAIEDCDLFVCLIGPNWLRLAQAKAAAAADGVQDTTAREIEAALHFDRKIFPLLVDGAEMPTVDLIAPEIRALRYQDAAVVSSAHSVEQLKSVLNVPAVTQVRAAYSLGRNWRRHYLALAVMAYLLCALVPNAVGSWEYGADAWLEMAKIWGGFYIWPVIFLPFPLFALRRPFTTLILCALRAHGAARRFQYAWPLVLSTLAAGAAWYVEVFDSHQVPWTIHPWQSGQDCQTHPPVRAAAQQSPPELFRFDSQGKLRQHYEQANDGVVPFWLRDGCWPNVLFFLNEPVKVSAPAVPEYLDERQRIQAQFARVLVDSTRLKWGVPYSYTGIAYQVSFAILAFLGVAGTVMAAYFSAHQINDPVTRLPLRLAAEDASVCLQYSLITLLLWIPFRMVTEYYKFLYSCEDLSNCGFQLNRYYPVLMGALMFAIALLFITFSVWTRFQRLDQLRAGIVMVVFNAALIVIALLYGKDAARFTTDWGFYLAIIIPLSIGCYFLWVLFEPASRRRRVLLERWKARDQRRP